jgi:hypothetical protein
MNVYIVWDKDRQEKGEIAELLDVFFSQEDADAYTASELCWASETAIEEREVKGSLSETEIRNLIAHVIAGARGGMRVVIGDQMAEYIGLAVRRALTKLGYIKEEAGEPEAASS